MPPLWKAFLAEPSDAARFDVATGALPCVFLSFGSSKDDSFETRRPGRATLTLLAPVRYEWFAPWGAARVKHRGADYDALKVVGRQAGRQALDGREDGVWSRGRRFRSEHGMRVSRTNRIVTRFPINGPK